MSQQITPENALTRHTETSLAAQPTAFSGLFAPDTRAEALELCEKLSRESWVPGCYRNNPMFVAIALDYAARFKIHTLAALNGIAVINGKPTIFGDLLLAVCRSVFPSMRMKQEYYRDLKLPELVGTGCRVTVSRPHTDGSFEDFQECFGEQQAKKAGLWSKKGPWSDYPERMCMFRARSYALRAAFPEVLSGYMSVEEAQDIRDVQLSGRPRRSETIVMPPREIAPPAPMTDEARAAIFGGGREAFADEPECDENGEVAPAGHTLAEVLHGFELARTHSELAQIVSVAAQLTDPQEKKQAREAYAERRAAIIDGTLSAGDRVLGSLGKSRPEPADAGVGDDPRPWEKYDESAGGDEAEA